MPPRAVLTANDRLLKVAPGMSEREPRQRGGVAEPARNGENGAEEGHGSAHDELGEAVDLDGGGGGGQLAPAACREFLADYRNVLAACPESSEA